MQITGIILAGGKSSRMGTDKTFIEIKGKSLLNYSIEFSTTFCDSLLISSNTGRQTISGISVVPDEIKDCGPLGGIYSCLKHSGTEWNFVISVDSPFVNAELIAYLKKRLNGYNAVVPVHNAGVEPLIAFYNKSCLPVVEYAIKTGDYKMTDLLSKLNTNLVNVDKIIAKHPETFRNLNSLSDLKNF